MGKLAIVYRNDPIKAKDLLERALNIQVKHYGRDNIHVAATLTGLGDVHRNLGDSVKAKDVLLRALNIQVKHFGQDHFDVAVTLTNLGEVYRRLGNSVKAKH